MEQETDNTIENVQDATTLRVSASARLRVAIFGGSGYGGAELLRLLLMHPHVYIDFVTANEHAGKAVGEVHRNLYGLTDLRFRVAPEESEIPEDLDFIFLSLPHGQAISIVPRLPKRVKIIDLSGDFRLRDHQTFERFYNRQHTAMEAQSGFVYGLTETNRDAIRTATRISNPGCFATATILALAPLVACNLLSGRVVVDAKTGSSGSGAKPAANTHHPQRMNSFYAYKPFTHQHVPEIEQELRAQGDWTSELVFMTHSLPVARGIFASVYVETKEEMTAEEVRGVFTRFYKDSFFVRLVEGSPDINWVKTTNFCDIGIASHGRQLVIFSALDNLVKGAAGQAVQNMNLMAGLDEKTGLILTGSNP
jgi:N-acetyl-gamma-glutamyl-phosphate reductase common form